MLLMMVLFLSFLILLSLNRLYLLDWTGDLKIQPQMYFLPTKLYEFKNFRTRQIWQIIVKGINDEIRRLVSNNSNWKS